MLKFIDDNDFMLVDEYKQNDDGSVSWCYQDGDKFHSGFLREGMTRIDGENTVDVWSKLQSKIKSGKVILITKSDEEIAREEIEQFKQSREYLVSQSVVETESGLKFDGDNTSIQKMANKILSLSYLGESNSFILEWSLADTDTGVMTEVSFAELKEAHHLAVEYVQSIWGI